MAHVTNLVDVGICRVGISRVSVWRDDWGLSDISSGVDSVEVPSDVLRARADDVGRHHLNWIDDELRLWLCRSETDQSENEDCQLKVES